MESLDEYGARESVLREALALRRDALVAAMAAAAAGGGGAGGAAAADAPAADGAGVGSSRPTTGDNGAEEGRGAAQCARAYMYIYHRYICAYIYI